METDQLTQYLPVLMAGLAAIALCVAMMGLNALLGWRGKRTPAKDTPYECGMEPAGGGDKRFPIHFYLVAMLFILFDIEVVFFYPWAVVYRDLLRSHANLILGAMLSFVGVLFVGYVYALKKGAFDSRRQ